MSCSRVGIEKETTMEDKVNNNSVHINSLFIYVLSSIAGGQLQSQHGIQNANKNTTNETKHT
jgi:hypothetical protein